MQPVYRQVYDETYSRATVTLEVKRHTQFYIWQMMVPLGIVLGMAFAVFFLPPKDLSDRMSVIIASLLTVVALSYSLHSGLPKISYLTIIDWFFVLAYAFLGLAMAGMVWISNLHDRDEAKAIRYDQWLRWAYPGAYLLASAIAVIVVGLITMWMGAIIGSAKDDIKKALAASTMSQIGYMMLAAGIGPAGYAFAIFHLLTHGFFKAGLFLGPNELPDYLPVVLQYASTQPPAQARAFLAEMAHIFNAIFNALQKRQSPYASILGALIELAGEKAHTVKVVADEPVDADWEEPLVFDGCSTKGQAKPGEPQVIHFVKPEPSLARATAGAAL